MNATLSIARRELREKTHLFGAAAALAVLPFLATLLPISRSWGSGTMVATVGGILAVAVALAVAIILGASTIGRDLSDGRLSFYFSKPVSPAAIWIGKAGAAVLLIVTTFAIVAVPTMLVAGLTWKQAWSDDAFGFFFGSLSAALALFFVSHVISTMVRSRSALLALDLLLALASIAASVLIVRPLIEAFAMGLAGSLIIAVAVAVLLIFMVAPVRQLSDGRADLRRNHAALSRIVWPAVAVVLLASAAYVTWVVSASPTDLKKWYARTAPAGDWLYAGGEARGRGGYEATFLINAATGQSVRLSGPPFWGATFSRDGRMAAYLKPIDMMNWSRSGAELKVVDLAGTDVREQATGITATPGSFALSDDGSRVAVKNDENLAVYDLATKRSLAAVRFGLVRGDLALFFVTPQIVRVLVRDREPHNAGLTLKVYELDVAKRTLTQTGQLALAGSNGWLRVTPGGAKMLVATNMQGGEAIIVDGRTCAELQRIPNAMHATLLADGTAASVVKTADGSLHLQTFGAASRDVPLPRDVQSAYVSRETADGKVLVNGRLGPNGSRVLIVDPAQGKIVRSEEGMRIAAYPWEDIRVAIPSNRVTAYDGDGKLVAWDVTTNAKRVLAGS
ncbi:MAG TPA: hypothetical protein VFN10_23590 [Thermoanaerobaculia bacterium]|nr:hypothetical protein [Thermoanaerobaculia bacterium]